MTTMQSARKSQRSRHVAPEQRMPTDPAPTSPDLSAAFRRTMGRLASTVGVLTVARHGGDLQGMTVSPIVRLPEAEPSLAVAFRSDTRTLAQVMANGAFAISILRDDQAPIAEAMSRPGEDRTHLMPLFDESGGIPVVREALAVIWCDARESFVLSNTTMVVGAVQRVEVRDDNPLIHFRGALRPLGQLDG
ncbi:flavin reductase family protein [Nocardioides sp. NPDC004968]|uniref:flavin reductase family protein n=1 Tax=Nocardioides sp. NPDC004968 TaxID=3155894 RepID=UPI0033A3040C